MKAFARLTFLLLLLMGLFLQIPGIAKFGFSKTDDLVASDPMLEAARRFLTEEEAARAELEKFNVPTVNFDFKDAQLSHVLLLLAKAGDLNIVFSESLDRKISIKLNEVKVVDGLQAILESNQLQYRLKGKTIIVGEKDFSEEQYFTMSLQYSSAREGANLLQQNKVKAFAHPSKNVVILYGTELEIKKGLQLLQDLDKEPFEYKYTLGYLNFREAGRVLKSKLKYSDLRIEKMPGSQTISLKGNEKEVVEAKYILDIFDVPQEPTKFFVEIFLLSQKVAKLNKDRSIELLNDTDISKVALERMFEKGALQKINSEFYKSEPFQALYNSSQSKLVFSRTFELIRGQELEQQVFDLPVVMERMIDQPGQFGLKLGEQELFYLSEDELVAFHTELDDMPIFKKAYHLRSNADVLVLVRPS